MEGLFVDEVSRETAPGGGVGSASPAVCEPRPSRCNVGASNLPLAFSPCDAWNLRIAAVVSRGGRPDLARDALRAVHAPTLLIVGSRDPTVLMLNRLAEQRLGGALRVGALELPAIDEMAFGGGNRGRAARQRFLRAGHIQLFLEPEHGLLLRLRFDPWPRFVEAAAVLLPELPEVVLLPEAAFT